MQDIFLEIKVESESMVGMQSCGQLAQIQLIGSHVSKDLSIIVLLPIHQRLTK